MTDETPYFDTQRPEASSTCRPGTHFWESVGKDLFRFLFTLRDDPRTPLPLSALIQAKILEIAYPNGVPAEQLPKPDDMVVE